MKIIDFLISIIMILIAAFEISDAASFGVLSSIIIILLGVLLITLVNKAANANPSLKTVIHVMTGFAFGLIITICFNISYGWLSGIICLICMGYKYLYSEALSVSRPPRSKNFFVVIVNALIYSSMLTAVMCIMFGSTSILFILIYIFSFALFFCMYVASSDIVRRTPVRGTSTYSQNAKGNIAADWEHILIRLQNALHEYKLGFISIGDNITYYANKLTKSLTHRFRYQDQGHINKSQYKSIQNRFDFIHHELVMFDNLDMDDNEIHVYNHIADMVEELWHEFYGKCELSYEGFNKAFVELDNEVEMLKNTIKVRKARDKEDEMRAKVSEKRRKEQQKEKYRKAKSEEENRKEDKAGNGKAANDKATNDKAANNDGRDKGYNTSGGETNNSQREDSDSDKERSDESHTDNKNADSNTGSGNSGADSNNANSGNGNGNTDSNKSNSSSGQKKSTGRYFSGAVGVDYFKGCKTPEELARRYKKLCQIYHPDSMGGDTDTYIKIKEEYEWLKKLMG